MFRTKKLALIIAFIILGVVGVNLLKSGITPDETGSQDSDTDITEPEDLEPEPPVDRLSLIPASAVKVTPETGSISPCPPLSSVG
jgi:hypothetical protein